MKYLMICFSFLALTCTANAHEFSHPTLATVAGSDSVYLVRVDSVKSGELPGSVNFSVTEVLRGNQRASLILEAFDDFEKGSEWILVHHSGGFKNGVGWALKGDCEWLPISLNDKDGKAFEYVGSLDQIRKYLQEHPLKP